MQSRAYFDNAATSFPKPDEVYSFADAFYRGCGASVGRGQYRAASQASNLLEENRELILQLFHCPGKQVVFTPSATEALNSIIQGSGLRQGSTVYYSPFEHNAVTRVLNYLDSEKGVIPIELPFIQETLEPDYEAIDELFDSKRPDMLVITHASNVIGLILPVARLAEIAKRHGAITVIDMSQTAGLLDMDLSSEIYDYAVFAGHKTLLAPFGIAGFVCKTGAMLHPIMFGGNGIDSANQAVPERLRDRIEVGSLNTYAIAGLNAALKYLKRKNDYEDIARIDFDNRKRLLELIRQHNEIEVIGDKTDRQYIGVVSVLLRGYSPDETGKVLDAYGIDVRTGMQCAPYAHKFLGTFPAGTVRFSISIMTTDNDYLILEKALSEIAMNA